MTKTTTTYDVTIRREGEEWVARDNDGNWRARGKAVPGMRLADVPTHLFHADEILAARVAGHTIRVTITTN